MRSTIDEDGEGMIPAGYGRGPRRTMFSKLWSWACWWRIECFNVEIWLRTATVDDRPNYETDE